MTELAPPLTAAPAEQISVESALNTDAHAVSFSELVYAHFNWWSNRADTVVDQALASRYDAARHAFEQRHGEIVSAYWCSNVESAVALTERPRLRGWVSPTWGFHRESDWATQSSPEVAAALHRCDELAVRANTVLTGVRQRICMQLVVASASHLLSLVDARPVADSHFSSSASSRGSANAGRRTRSHHCSPPGRRQHRQLGHPPRPRCPCSRKTTSHERGTTVLLREKLVENEVAATKLGIREVGGNNHGPWVKKFLAEVGLPEGYAWCDAFQSFEMDGVAGHRLPIESASVAQTYVTGKKLGWAVSKPARGDLVCYDFDGDGQFDDHIGLVVGVLSLGPMMTLQTVEGNTSSGVAGSQGDGDGVFLRRRVVSAKSVGFIRIPGDVADPVVPSQPEPAIQGESKNETPFTTPVTANAPAPEVLSEHGSGQ